MAVNCLYYYLTISDIMRILNPSIRRECMARIFGTLAADGSTEEGVKTSVDYVSGVILKLTLAGETSTDLDYSIAYE